MGLWACKRDSKHFTDTSTAMILAIACVSPLPLKPAWCLKCETSCQV